MISDASLDVSVHILPLPGRGERSMSTTAQVSAHIIRLSQRHDVEPLGVVGLLALHALVEVDFTRLRYWKEVAGEMAAAA